MGSLYLSVQSTLMDLTQISLADPARIVDLIIHSDTRYPLQLSFLVLVYY